MTETTTTGRPLDIKGDHCPNCGGPMKHRSTPDHKMYWSVMREAFKQWPAHHAFKPDNPEHLHGWLMIEVGARECVEVETTDKSVAIAVAKGMFAVIKRHIHCMRVFGAGAGGIRICIPESLSYESAGKKKYESVRSAIYETIEAIVGVKIDDLKRADDV